VGVATYRDYIAGNPKTWSPHRWETSTDSIILSYTEMGFYDFQLTPDRTSYVIQPEMATDIPQDKTVDYDDTYKIARGVPTTYDSGLIYDIPLNPEARWENGEAITASDYVQSMKQLLNPKLINGRASGFYQGQLSIGNAEKYFKSNRDVYVTETEFNADQAAGNQPVREAGNNSYFSFYHKYSGLGGLSVANLFEENSEKPITYNGNEILLGNHPDLVTLKAYLNNATDYGSVFNPIYVKTINNNSNVVPTYNNIRTAVLNLVRVIRENDQTSELPNPSPTLFGSMQLWKATYPNINFESSVGITRKDDYTITLWLSKPLKGFDLLVMLSGNFLVHIDTYMDAMNQTQTSTAYGTEARYYKSYGPYKLDTYQLDKGFNLSRNTQWYGYSAERHQGFYTISKLSFEVIKNHPSAMLAFKKGELDGIGFQNKTESDEFKGSSLLMRAPETYTTKLTLNSDREKLVARQNAASSPSDKVNKTLLANHNFRKAFSWSLDRNNFAQNHTSGGKGFVVPINTSYVPDPDPDSTTGFGGQLYRNFPQAKAVVSGVYGSNTYGYDVTYAKSLLETALQEELNSTEAGAYRVGDRLEIEFHVYTSDEIYTQMATFIQDNLRAITTGTSLEGKVNIVTFVDSDYYDNAQLGNTDMIFSTWGGASLNMFVLVEAYCDESELFEYGFHPATTPLTIDLDGPDGYWSGQKDGDGNYIKTDIPPVTKTYGQWMEALLNGEYSSAQANVYQRTTIFAAIERGLVEQYRFTSLYERNSVSIRSTKINYGTNQYLYIIGFGGIREMTFNYNDDDWASYVQSHNNDLTEVYKLA
jgi:ABC-type oligopeptide transport system substrate-binding subunit